MKIAIIGSGNIGSATASILINSGICKSIALVDLSLDFAKGRAKDLLTMATILGKEVDVFATSDYEELKKFDIFVITAGVTRKVGQSRDELLSINAKIIKEIATNIKKLNSNPLIIVVSNPVDILTFVMQKEGGFDPKRVIGMAGELDSARAVIAYKELVGKKKLPYILGLHNDKMSFVYQEEIEKSKKEPFEKEVITGGAKITELTKTSAYFAPAGAIYKMIEAILHKKVVIASVYNDGYYFGRRVELCKDGVSKILKDDICLEAIKKELDLTLAKL